MTGIKRTQLARIGEFYLEEAILDVLLKAKHAGSCVGPAEISKQAGIYRDRGKEDMMNDAIIFGMLSKLADENKVKRCTQSNDQGGWELTESQFATLRDEI